MGFTMDILVALTILLTFSSLENGICLQPTPSRVAFPSRLHLLIYTNDDKVMTSSMLKRLACKTTNFHRYLIIIKKVYYKYIIKN